MKLPKTLLCATLLACTSLFTHASASLADNSTDLGDGWMHSTWFGDFMDMGGDWFYQEKWGYFYQIDGGTDSAWIYVPDEGWFWIDGSSYPSTFRYTNTAWVWFWDDTSNPRLYYNYTDTSWIASDGSDGQLWHTYYEAIVDASVAEADEICKTLIPVTDYNNSLEWDASHTHIKVVSWMPSTYISSYTENQPITLNWETWVSAAPEVQQFAASSALSLDAVVMRTKQRLGLRPDKAYAYWVEFWVLPTDLYRPSADPYPGDCEAQLTFTDSPESSVSADYKQWYNDTESTMYVLSRNGFPWTRLGYTYDWGDPTDEVGFSEFIIRLGTTALVGEIYTNEEYLLTP